MTSGGLIDLWRNALTVTAAVSAPFLLAALAVGLLISIVQTATQLQESTLSFVPKLGAALLVIALCGHWALGKLGTFAEQAFTAHVSAQTDSSPTP